MMIGKQGLSRGNVFVLFIVVFLFAYYPAYLTHYAYTDDWTNLYWANFDQRSILNWDTLSGRPVYGIIQYAASFIVDSVEKLALLRAVAIILLIFTGYYLYTLTQKYALMESQAQRITFSLLLCLLPSFQVYIAWASCFPYIAAILLAGASYRWSVKPGVAGPLLAIFLLTIAFCIYQPAAMSFTFFAMLDLCLSARRIDKKRAVISLVVLGAGMFAALIASKVLPVQLYGHALPRSAFSYDLLNKVKWFFSEYLKNIICHFDLGAKTVSVILSLIVIGFGLKKIKAAGTDKFCLIFFLLLIAALPNLIVSESMAAYRTLIAGALISTSIFIVGLFEISQKFKWKKCLYAALVLAAASLAISHLNNGYSVPARKEFALLNQAITSQVPKDFHGALYYRLTGEYLPKVATLRKYDDFGGLGLSMSWTFAGMAHFIRQQNGMAFTLPANPVITDEAGCPGDCLVIDSRAVLRQPH
ncbi:MULTISPECIES: glucosyltransferase domain-containing protein [Pantoea]|jgi:hypothetical protein|uniref:Glucosyl transferase GtrII family protein n=1 Tax=Pantoea brenneri TaxID=472694 RepID=A0A7Y6NBC5_9GAMM|nr:MULTISPECIES: glucosyltransferase domain-containing protein [Pantoea]MBZ6393725.1 glucosyltransferase domain-containing protein [Pantoea sp.]MBZ6437292.1 glucosyltransferase domain-containing protein [Pantoea sp.]MCQ5469659.1 glucosyltransferase domain-containing protein [Pantoea brenneri]MDU4127194.1 hypothetical protein [Pantoea sp.]MDU4745199.1 hypothetical protein [Pantoea sp.]